LERVRSFPPVLTRLSSAVRTSSGRAVVVVVGYLLSRLMYVVGYGVHFDDAGLASAFQFLDPSQLRENLLRSVFYEHIQPPLYNLYLGLGLRFPNPHAFFVASARAIGLALHLGLFDLTRRLGARPSIAALVATVFAFSPASILYETWLFYSFPVAAMLTLAACLLHRALETERPRAWWAAFLLMAAVVLTRSLFHLVWLVLAVALAVFASRHRRRALVIAALPVALAATLYVKNRVVFGRFAASSWMGFSLSRLTTQRAPVDVRRQLIEQGRLSPLALTLAWEPLDHYPPEYQVIPQGLPRVPVLTEPLRAGGYTNYNHAAFLRISETFLADARVMMAEDPAMYRDCVRVAWMIYFRPTYDGLFLERRSQLRGIERLYELAIYSPAWRWSWGAPEPPRPDRMSYGWIAIGAVVVPISLFLAWRGRRRPEGPTILFCLATTAWVAVIGNLFEIGENNRFRFLTEPLAWALCGLVFDRAGRKCFEALRTAARRRSSRDRTEAASSG
jgi:hypothetical protein